MIAYRAFKSASVISRFVGLDPCQQRSTATLFAARMSFKVLCMLDIEARHRRLLFSWIIGERMTGTAGPMPFNAAFPEEVPTGRIDPLLVADVPASSVRPGLCETSNRYHRPTPFF
jgi:hypothetical protein